MDPYFITSYVKWFKVYEIAYKGVYIPFSDAGISYGGFSRLNRQERDEIVKRAYKNYLARVMDEKFQFAAEMLMDDLIIYGSDEDEDDDYDDYDLDEEIANVLADAYDDDITAIEKNRSVDSIRIKVATLNTKYIKRKNKRVRVYDLSNLMETFYNMADSKYLYNVAVEWENDYNIEVRQLRLIIDPNNKMGANIGQLEYLFAKKADGEYMPVVGSVSYILFIFNPILVEDNLPPVSRESVSLNCFIDIIKDRISASDLKKYEKKYKNGISVEEIIKVCDKYKINVIMKDVLNNEWFKYDKYQKKKKYVLTHHNNHVTLFTKDTQPVLQEFLSHDELQDMLYKCDKKMVVSGFRSFIMSIQVGSTIYKNKDYVFVSRDDYLKNKDKIKINTLTFLSRVFNYVKNFYKFYPIQYLPESLQKFVAAADYPQIIYYKEHKKLDSYHHYDQKRAYSQYINSIYYAKYKLPTLPTHFYEVTSEQGHKLLYKTGFSYIVNVSISSEFLRDIQFIQNNSVYTNLRLQYIKDNNLATFDIKYVAFSNVTEDIDFNITELDDAPIEPDKLKYIQNSILGKLIPNPERVKKCVTTKNIVEFDHLRYVLKDDIIDAGYEDEIYYVEYVDREIEYKTYHHIHSYITDYQKISIIKFIHDNYKIFAYVNTDGVYLTDKAIRAPVKGEYMKMPLMERLRCVKTVVKCHTHVIEDPPITMPYFYDFDINHSNHFTKSNLFYIEGIAGVGKTYNFIKNKLYNSVILFPTNDLKDGCLIECYTYHKFYNINNPDIPNKPYLYYSNVIIDEASMIGKKDFSHILKYTPPHVNIYVISGIKQLAPVDDDPITNKQLCNFKKIALTDIKRTNNKDFISKQLKMLSTDNISEKIAIFSDNIITEQKFLREYSINDIIISSTNDTVNYYNNILYNRYSDGDIIPVAYLRTTSNYFKNQRVYIKKSEFNREKYKLCFASTIHLVQGRTLNNNLYFINKNIWCSELINVAFSRNTDISKLFIVNIEKKMLDNNYDIKI